MLWACKSTNQRGCILHDPYIKAIVQGSNPEAHIWDSPFGTQKNRKIKRLLQKQQNNGDQTNFFVNIYQFKEATINIKHRNKPQRYGST